MDQVFAGIQRIQNLLDILYGKEAPGDIINELNTVVVGCLAKLEHRIQVQRNMIKFLDEKVAGLVTQSGIPWVPRSLPEADDSSPYHGLNKAAEVLQNDSCVLAELLEWIRKETEGVRARIEEMQDILRTFGESEGEMLKTEADAQANVTILDDLEEHYGGLLMKMELNAKRIEEQRADLTTLLRSLGYVPKDSQEQLLISVLQDKCPIPPQLRKKLVRFYLCLRDLEKIRKMQVARLDREIESLCEWLELPKEACDDLSGLSEAAIGQKEKRVNQLKQEQIAKIDVVYERKLKVAHEYCQALNEGDRLKKLLGQGSSKLDLIGALDEVINALRPKFEASSTIRTLIKERHELIQQMKAFEVSASDPARLFQPSFRLLQEEKFRKSALPNLLRLEGKLRAELGRWEGKFGYEGEEDWGGRMEEEIATRYVNETVFGFSTENSTTAAPRSIISHPKSQKTNITNSSSSNNKDLLPHKRMHTTK